MNEDVSSPKETKIIFLMLSISEAMWAPYVYRSICQIYGSSLKLNGINRLWYLHN